MPGTLSEVIKSTVNVRLTVLVNEHANGDPAHVEAIQKVLNVLARDRVGAKRIPILDDTLGHGGHHIVVPVPNGHESFDES